VPLANILCVDDSELGLFVRQLVLQSCGHTVVTATTAEQALSLFQLAQFDLVVADYFLGSETGEDLARKLKLQRPHVGVLMLSGSPDVAISAADAFLVKGGNPRSLIDAVEELLGAGEQKARAIGA
jgi:CheY-like chemotaxis protein